MKKINKVFNRLSVVLLITIFIYILGSFIALDFNVLHWEMYTDEGGRICLSIISIVVMLFVIYGKDFERLEKYFTAYNYLKNN